MKSYELIWVKEAKYSFKIWNSFIKINGLKSKEYVYIYSLLVIQKPKIKSL